MWEIFIQSTDFKANLFLKQTYPDVMFYQLSLGIL